MPSKSKQSDCSTTFWLPEGEEDHVSNYTTTHAKMVDEDYTLCDEMIGAMEVNDTIDKAGITCRDCKAAYEEMDDE